MKCTIDLFEPVVPLDRLHPNFKRVLADTDWDIREVLSDWAKGFFDRDGKFVQEFQLTFNSSWWELYLFAVLKSLDIKVDFSYAAPDFVASDSPLAIEAVIANHAADATPEWEKTLKEAAFGEDIEARWLQTLARLYNSIDGKRALYERRYRAMPHMKEKSFVIALQNFSTPDSFQLGDVAMQRLLYDVEDRGTFLKNGRTQLPLGIFSRQEFRCVSAVMYSSVATYGKVRALGRSDLGLVFQAVRIRNNTELVKVTGDKSEYRETLRDGLRVFHNPNADTPLPDDLFDVEDVREFRVIDGDLAASSNPEGDLCMRQVFRIAEKP